MHSNVHRISKTECPSMEFRDANFPIEQINGKWIIFVLNWLYDRSIYRGMYNCGTLLTSAKSVVYLLSVKNA